MTTKSRSPRSLTPRRGTTSTPSGSVAARHGVSPERNLASSPGAHWTFLTNHAHVLILLARNPDRVLREVAHEVGITERAVQRIIVDLEAAGVIEREKVGRKNHYRISARQPLRHPIESHRTIADLLEMVGAPETA